MQAAASQRVVRPSRSAVVVRAQSQESTSRRAFLGLIASGMSIWSTDHSSSSLQLCSPAWPEDIEHVPRIGLQRVLQPRAKMAHKCNVRQL